MSVLSEPRFHDPLAALAHVEAVLWPNGPVCPHCGATDRIYDLRGKSTKPGVRKCGHCRKLFTVTVGTIMEGSHLPLTKWLQALHLLCSSKKGISSHQLHRTLEITYKTAWFLSHRIREAMRDGSLGPLGGKGYAVEADETFIGRKDGAETPKGGYSHKNAVLALVERGGKVRTFHIDGVTKEEIGRIVRENIARESWLMTDEARHYREVGTEFAGHSRVHHTRGEYVDPDDFTINTQTVEGFFGQFKPGFKAVYQHCSPKHLHRYLAEYEFRYNNRIALGVDDRGRAANALLGVVGKRLTYRRVGGVPLALMAAGEPGASPDADSAAEPPESDEAMPQPVKRLVGALDYGPHVLLERPDLATLIAVAAATHTEVENRMGYVFSLMLAKEERSALAAYLGLIDRNPRQAVFMSVARDRLPRDLQQQASNLFERLRKVGTERNNIVHATWAINDKRQESLISMDAAEYSLLKFKMDHSNFGEMASLWIDKLKHVKMLEWKEKDSKAVIDRINALDAQIMSFGDKVWLLFPSTPP